MQVTLAQINTTPGAFQNNYKQICEAIEIAKQHNTQMLVFPEATICGYGVRDLMYNPDFVNKNLHYLQKVCQESIGYEGYIFIGYIENNTTGVGKKFRNAVAVIYHGLVVAKYYKQLLPFYDVFDEGRYFEPGHEPCIVDVFGKRVGILVCEDLWNDKGQDDYSHHVNPVQQLREAGVDMIVSLNSSPYTRGKQNIRRNMIGEIIRHFPEEALREGIIYVNQYGAQDELVFDGNSMIIDRAGEWHIPTPVVPVGDMCAVGDIVNIDTGHYSRNNAVVGERTYGRANNDSLPHAMVMLGLFDYARKTGFKQMVLGSSGGIDSAVVIAMGSILFGANNVHGVRMPSIYSSAGSKDDALKLHQNLGCNDYLNPIDHEPLLQKVNIGYGFDKKPYNEIADENIQSRLRGLTTMHFANAMQALAVGTCNKCEAACGYFTLFGDSANLFNPLIDLYKMEVYRLANFINANFGNPIPKEIINKAPSAELKPGQTDEASLMPYVFLDQIVKGYIENNITTHDAFIKNAMNDGIKAGVTKEGYDRIVKIIERNEFKRRLVAMGPKLTVKAFGTGRRIPVVKG